MNELPLDASAQIELPLTSDQAALFAGITDLQRLRRGSVIFLVLASSYLPSERKGILRLQAKLVDRKSAAAALKILRKSEIES